MILPFGLILLHDGISQKYINWWFVSLAKHPLSHLRGHLFRLGENARVGSVRTWSKENEKGRIWNGMNRNSGVFYPTHMVQMNKVMCYFGNHQFLYPRELR